jgi:hypothetical protein
VHTCGMAMAGGFTSVESQVSRPRATEDERVAIGSTRVARRIASRPPNADRRPKGVKF